MTYSSFHSFYSFKIKKQLALCTMCKRLDQCFSKLYMHIATWTLCSKADPIQWWSSNIFQFFKFLADANIADGWTVFCVEWACILGQRILNPLDWASRNRLKCCFQVQTFGFDYNGICLHLSKCSLSYQLCNTCVPYAFWFTTYSLLITYSCNLTLTPWLR